MVHLLAFVYTVGQSASKAQPQKVTLGAVLLMEILTCVQLSWYPKD